MDSPGSRAAAALASVIVGAEILWGLFSRRCRFVKFPARRFDHLFWRRAIGLAWRCSYEALI